jgi:membrane-associated phospholipid phosphatase
VVAFLFLQHIYVDVDSVNDTRRAAELHAIDAVDVEVRALLFLGTGLLALGPTVAYFAVTGADPVQATMGNSWAMDALVASGLFITAGVTWFLWKRFDWGSIVPGAMEALAAVAVPYAVLSPVWNVSGHVIIALMPTLYLTLVDRKFWPLLAVPVVMVPNRIYLGAHTWTQAIGGFLIATVVVMGIYWLRLGGESPRALESVTR